MDLEIWEQGLCWIFDWRWQQNVYPLSRLVNSSSQTPHIFQPAYVSEVSLKNQFLVRFRLTDRILNYSLLFNSMGMLRRGGCPKNAGACKLPSCFSPVPKTSISVEWLPTTLVGWCAINIRKLRDRCLLLKRTPWSLDLHLFLCVWYWVVIYQPGLGRRLDKSTSWGWRRNFKMLRISFR